MSDFTTGINQIGRVGARVIGELDDRPARELHGASEGRTPDPELTSDILRQAKATPEDEAAFVQGISADADDPVEQHLKEIGEDTEHPLQQRAIRRAAFERIPFGTRSFRLTAPQRKGFQRHWFTNKPGRINRALRAGWKHVKDDIDGKPMNRVSGTYDTDTKDGQKSYLMEMPQEWFDADQRQTLNSVAEIEQTIRRGEVAIGDGKYVPRDPATGNMLVRMDVERQGSALAPLVPNR